MLKECGVRKFLLVLVGVFFVSLTLLTKGNLASAETNSVDYNVNIATTLNMTLSTNNITLNLRPNNKAYDSGNLGVTVSTNNSIGYTVVMSSAGGATALARDNTGDGINASIPTLSSEAGTTASSLADNTWGYRVNNTGNFVPYSSGARVIENNQPTNGDTSTLTFASKINYDQIVGSYSLGLVFEAVANPLVQYIQNLDPSLCTSTPLTVVDRRDDNEYTVARINGNCWMTQNLRYVGDSDSASGYMKMSATTSNINENKNFIYRDLDKTINSTEEYYYSYSTPSLHVADTTDKGVWYNYAAASATTITGDTNSDDGVYDICPKGWRLPTKSEYDGILSYANDYNTVLGGYYTNGSISSSSSAARWWSSTPNSSTAHYRLVWNNSALSTGTGGGARRLGYYVRCIRSS